MAEWQSDEPGPVQKTVLEYDDLGPDGHYRLLSGFEQRRARKEWERLAAMPEEEKHAIAKHRQEEEIEYYASEYRALDANIDQSRDTGVMEKLKEAILQRTQRRGSER